MSKTLVTGATGLVGYNIAAALLTRGKEVRVLARTPGKAQRVVPEGCEIVAGDVTDADSCAAAVAGCQAVYHAAGLPEQWVADASVFDRVNAGGTANMIAAASAAKVAIFVHTSTQDVFQAGAGETFDESRLDPAPKATAYQRSKQQADRLVTQAAQHGLPAVLLHPCAVYGPGPAQSPGMNDFFADLIGGKIPLLLAGGMGLVHAADTAEAHILAAEALAAGKIAAGARYIVAGSYYTLRELAEAVRAQVASVKVPPVMPVAVARIVSEAGELFAKLSGKPPLIARGQLHGLLWGARPSAARAEAELGWKSRPLPEGLAETLAHLRAVGRIGA